MTWASSDRWSCPHPGCAKTVVVDASDEDTAAAIAACQQRHYRLHRATETARTRKFVRALEQDDRKRRRTA